MCVVYDAPYMRFIISFCSNRAINKNKRPIILPVFFKWIKILPRISICIFSINGNKKDAYWYTALDHFERNLIAFGYYGNIDCVCNLPGNHMHGVVNLYDAKSMFFIINIIIIKIFKWTVIHNFSRLIEFNIVRII